MDSELCKICGHMCHCSNGGSCCGGQCECMNCKHSEELKPDDEKSVDFDPDFSLTIH